MSGTEAADGLDQKRNEISELEAYLAETKLESSSSLAEQARAVDEERLDKYKENLLAEIEYEKAAQALLARAAAQKAGTDAPAAEEPAESNPGLFRYGGNQSTVTDGDSADEGE